MAMFDWFTARSAAPVQTATGQQGRRWPEGLDKQVAPHGACEECSKKATHGPPCKALYMEPTVGETRFTDATDATEIPEHNQLMLIQKALWAVSYVSYGIIRSAFNVGLGTANNSAQQVSLEIVSVSGSTLYVKGLGGSVDPKRIEFSRSRTNPSWPFPDPVTGSTARLVNEPYFVSLPSGAACVFGYPSVLSRKLEPWIERIIPGSGVIGDDDDPYDFQIVLSHSASNAKGPIDRKFPADRYTVTLYWYATFPEAWDTFGEYDETHFTKADPVTLDRTALDDLPGVTYDLDNTSGGSTRCLYPSMVPTDPMRVRVFRTNGTIEELSPSAIEAKLTTTQIGASSWTTTINLSVEIADATVANVIIEYWPEAVSGDEYLIPWQGSCSNSVEDETNSYRTDGLRRCTAVDCDQYGSYEAECWQPDASRFALGPTGAGVPTMSNVRDATWMERLWSRVAWRKDQALEGLNFFSLTRPANAGPGIFELLGGFYQGVLGGYFGSRESVNPAIFGRRTIDTDVDGNVSQTILYGATVSREEQDAAAAPLAGSLATAVSGWAVRSGQLNTSEPVNIRHMPSFGAGEFGLHDFTHRGGSFAVRNQLTSYNVERFLTGRRWALAESVSDDDGTFRRFRFDQEIPADVVEAEQVIVTGEVVSKSRSGDTLTVVCAREGQPADYFIGRLDGGPATIVYFPIMGGNVVSTNERQRVPSFANPSATTGDDSGRRCIPGDVLRVDGGGLITRALVTNCEAHGRAPGSVNYESATPLPTITYLNADHYEVELSAVEGEIIFDTTATGLFAGQGVDWTWVDDPDFARATMTRVIATNPESGEPDEDYLPDNLDLPPNQYIAVAGRSFRFSSELGDFGEDPPILANGVQVRWFLSGLLSYNVGAAASVVVEPESGTPGGYGGAADSLSAASLGVGNDNFEQLLTIESGSGSVEWRRDTANDAVVIALNFTGSGVSGSTKRTTAGGTAATTAGVQAYTVPFEVRVRKSGTTIDVSHRQSDADSWTVEDSITAGDVLWDGIFSLTTVSGARAKGFAGEVLAVGIGATAKVAALQFTTEPYVAFREYTQLSGRTIQSVRNETTGEAMSLAVSSNGRGSYGISGTTIFLYAEAAGDVVRVTYAAPSVAPSGPGRPPQVRNLDNWATENSPGSGVASTNTAENHANWHDTVDIYDPDGEMEARLSSGVTFQMVRGGSGWDPRNPPALAWDERNNGITTWASVPSESFRVRALEREVEILESWLDANAPDGASLCLRATGPEFQAGRLATGMINEVQDVLDGLEDLWVEVGLGFSGVFGSVGYVRTSQNDTPGSGNGGIIACRPTGHTCHPTFGWVPTGFDWGQSRDYLIRGDSTGAGFYKAKRSRFGDPWVMNNISNTQALWHGFIGNVPVNTTESTCNSNFVNTQEETVGSYLGAWAPQVLAPSALALVGSSLEFPLGVGSVASSPGFFPNFEVNGVPFNAAALFKRLPEGAEIITARLEVTALGLESSVERMEHQDQSSDLETGSYQYYRHNELTEEFTKGWNGDPDILNQPSPIPPQWIEGGGIGLALLGIRRNTANVIGEGNFTGDTLADPQVLTWDDRIYNLPGDVPDFIGASISTTIATGEQRVIDVTGAIQALVEDRDSLNTSYFLWPSVGAPVPSGTARGLGSYLRSLEASRSVSFVIDADGNPIKTTTVTCRQIRFESLSLGKLHIRYRMSGESASSVPLGVNLGPSAPEA